MSSVDNNRNIINDLDFCVIDLETTGGDHQKDRIFEIGLVKIKNLKITEKKEFRINPGVRIPPYVQKLTSVTNEELKKERSIDEVIDEVIEFIGTSILVAHNASFDVPFIKNVVRSLRKTELKNNYICTQIMTKYLLPESNSSNLTFLAKLFEIKNHSAHRALSDAVLTGKILMLYLGFIDKRGIHKINQIYYPKNRYELDRIHLKDKKEVLKVVKDLIRKEQTFSLTLKSEQGLILNSIPYHHLIMSEDYILNSLENSDAIAYSVFIHGGPIRALLEFKNSFLNINKSNRVLTLEALKSKLENLSQVSKPIKNMLIFFPHIMPNQFSIIDGESLNTKQMLIFTFPGQEKKLVNFVNSHYIKKRKHGGLHALHKDINNLLSSLILLLQEKNECLLIQKKNFPRSLKFRNHEVFDQVAEVIHDSDFPKNHL